MNKFLHPTQHGTPPLETSPPFDYSDGDAIETRLLTLLQNCTDVSCASIELRQHMTDWPSRYHLSPARHNLLRPFRFFPGDRILELGCGCGALTRYLGETGADVIAIEGSPRRTAIAKERCRDQTNVQISCGNIMDYRCDQGFDYVLLIGVLEYAPKYIDDPDPMSACLKHAASLLVKSGTLILAIENQLGLKYFNGCNEDHIGIPYYGIHGLYKSADPTTLGKQQLIGLLNAAGLERQEFFYPFPDYKLPQIVVSEGALRQPEFKVSDLLCRTAATNPEGDFLPVFHENMAWRTIEKNGLMGDLANSFLVLAGNDIHGKLNDWLACSYTTERLPEFSTETRFQTEEDGLQVTKRHLFASTPEATGALPRGELKQCLASKSPYVIGEIYLVELQRLLGRGGGLDDLCVWADRWIDILVAQARRVDGIMCLDGSYLDAIPANYVRRHDDGTLKLIDFEWQVTTCVPFAWVLVRGLMNSIAASPISPKLESLTFRQVIGHVLARIAPKTGVNVDEAFATANEYENALRGIVFGVEFDSDQVIKMLDAPAIKLIGGRTIHDIAVQQRHALQILQPEISRIKSTFSWKITKPLRFIFNLPRFIHKKYF